MNRLFLVDGSNTAFRAFFAIQSDMRAPDGLPTRALFGFTRILLKLLKDHQPSHVAVVFDKGLSFRNEIYPAYKGQRPDMPEDLRAQWGEFPGLCEELGVCAYVRDGYEADDIIGTLCVRHAGPETQVVIVSSDKDFGQLVNEHVCVLDLGKDELLGPEGIEQKWGVRPDQVIDFLSLMGDASDNVPGIAGVGPKKAADYLKRFGTAQAVIDNAAAIGGKTGQNIADSQEVVDLARRLVTIKVDFTDEEIGTCAELSALAVRPFDRVALGARMARYNFRSLGRELGVQESGDGGEVGDPAAAPEAPPSAIDRSLYRCIQQPADLASLVQSLRAAGRFAYDCETTSLDTAKAELVGMSFCWSPEHAVYVPIAHRGPEGDEDPNLNCPGALQALLPLLADPTLKKTGQNLKYDLSVLAARGHALAGIDGDTMLADYVLDVDHKHNLDDLARRHLGHTMLSFSEVAGPHGDRFERVPLDRATAYAAEDAHVAWLLDQLLTEQLKALGEEGPWKVYREIDLPLVPVLSSMERAGIAVDHQALTELGIELEGRIAELVERLHSEAGKAWNVNSTQQLGQILFEERGHAPTKKTGKKTAFSTDSETLESLARTPSPATGMIDPLPGLVLQYRELAKLKGTYVDALPKAVAEDGRIHTSFHQAVAATGRLSSNDPNLQNIPIRTEEGRRIRRCFVAAPGMRLVSADYSQIELRVLAHYCAEGPLVEAFLEGQDIHRRTAAEIFGVAMGLVSNEQRRAAKAINFGIVYGMSAFRLARELDIGRAEAARYIDEYFARYPQVRRVMEQAVQEATSKGYATTLFGRRRIVRGLDSKNFNERGGAERIAINSPIQGSAADLIKLAMVKVHRRLGAELPQARLLLQVHDELLVECPAAQVEAVRVALREEMSGVYELIVPLVVDVGEGATWMDAH